MKICVLVSAAVVIAMPLQSACSDEGDVSNKSGTSPYVIVDTKSIVLKNVTIFVGDGGAPLVNYSILIEGDRVSAVRPVGTIELPHGAAVIDLTGKSVMPGIVGLHNHLHMPGVSLMGFTAPRMYLASGVTTIQTAGSADAVGELRLAKAILAGDLPGPRIFTSSPYITGPGGNESMFIPDGGAQAREFVNRWADLGVTGFKLYRH